MKNGTTGTRCRMLASVGVLLAIALLGGCGTYFDLDEAEKRARKKDRANGYRQEPTRWQKMKEWERVKYRDWYRRMTDD